MTYLIDGEEVNLLDADWDVLVVLDACRYDYFERQYRDFLPGEVKEAVSPATCTPEWLNTFFSGKYDLTYISANPYINSKAFANTDVSEPFKASDHFTKVVDVWYEGWSKDLGCAPPWEVNKSFLDNYTGEGRYIVHYIQPHFPYIAEEYQKYKAHNLSIPDGFLEKDGMGVKHSKGVRKMLRPVMVPATRAVLPITWRLTSMMGDRVGKTQYAQIYLNEGWAGLRKAYELNLKIALEQVAELLKLINGKVLITADHGEFLGEGWRYSHPPGAKRRENTHVPWLELECESDIQPQAKLNGHSQLTDETIILQRLKLLGYM